jgi:hypothetical protein
MTKKYYIENCASGEVLNTDDTWAPFVPGGSAQSFTTAANAETEIATLDAGDYRIFTRYTVE